MKRGVSPAFILILAMLVNTSCLASNEISVSRRAELVSLVRNDCGSCHGLTLKGGLGPALLPISLQDKALEGLRETILRGRTATAMPPWDVFMNEAEANWIVEQLMKGFPNAH